MKLLIMQLSPPSRHIRERLAMNKQGSHRSHTEMIILKNVMKVEIKENYRVEVSNNFATLEGLDTRVEFNILWEKIRENIEVLVKENLC
jgi:hypothetical protein